MKGPKIDVPWARGMGSLGASWEMFRKHILPKDAHPIQIQETRRGFYAGASAWFSLMLELDPGEEPTEADMDKVEALYQELMTFSKDIEAGRA